jgi:hypothetical protein
MAIDNIDINTNDHQVVDETQSSVGVRACDKDVIIQKKPTAGIETLEPVMETMVRSKTLSPFDFLILPT